MVALVRTVAYLGLEARSVEVQCSIAPGLPKFNIVGLADKAVGESKERVRAALSSMGLALPPKRITINLSPADLPKEGSHYDLPVALALLAAMGVTDAEQLGDFVAVGELALDGRVVPSPGVLLAALIPILSDARGVQLIVKKWERKKRLPDAIVIEHPRLAGGHLGAARIADLNDPRFEFENVIPQSLAFLRSAGIEREIPLIAAGGIRSCEDIARVQALGAAAVQLGTPFAVTSEGDAHAEFKRVLAQARDDEMVEFTSVAGLPARAVATPWLRSYLRIEGKLQAVAHPKARCTKSFDCLAQCGLRDGSLGWGQFCIDNQLAAALRGDVKKGLFFRGVGNLPFGSEIRSVRELIERLLTPGALQPA